MTLLYTAQLHAMVSALPCLEPTDETLAIFEKQDVAYTNKLWWGNISSRDEFERLTELTIQDLNQYYKPQPSSIKDLPNCPKLYVKKVSDSIGYGTFTQEHIMAGDFVGEYTGCIHQSPNFLVSLPNNPTTRRSLDYSFSYIMLDNTSHFNLVIDASCCGNETRFINHAHQANVEARLLYDHNGLPRLCLFAIMDIWKNTELYLDYGPGYWKARNQNPE